MSLVLKKYVHEENAFNTRRIAFIHKRAPLQGELIDLTNASSRAKLKAYIESMLEDEVLHQDGERDLKEALAEGVYLTKLLNALEKYK